jgi:hypothetical protein
LSELPLVQLVETLSGAVRAAGLDKLDRRIVWN